jgi:tRNA uridine 5-carbamoylmethylation protein Kti12
MTVSGIIVVSVGVGTDIPSFSDSRSEKPARATLFTAVQRQMSQDLILIVDASNYIKGFRYQMYCAARELKLRVCTVRNPHPLKVSFHDTSPKVDVRCRDGRIMQGVECRVTT